MTTTYEYCEHGYNSILSATTLDGAIAEAEELLRSGDWELSDRTVFVSAAVVSDDVSHLVTVAINPSEPACEPGREHHWCWPHKVLGGIKENPGVWGNGGGTVTKDVCSHCGQYRVTDTWATNPCDGRQGYVSVCYEPADEASLAWIEG